MFVNVNFGPCHIQAALPEWLRGMPAKCMRKRAKVRTLQAASFAALLVDTTHIFRGAPRMQDTTVEYTLPAYLLGCFTHAKIAPWRSPSQQQAQPYVQSLEKLLNSICNCLCLSRKGTAPHLSAMLKAFLDHIVPKHILHECYDMRLHLLIYGH